MVHTQGFVGESEQGLEASTGGQLSPWLAQPVGIPGPGESQLAQFPMWTGFEDVSGNQGRPSDV